MDQLKELLYRSFDEQLNPKEQKKLEAGLASSKELAEEKEAISRMRSQLSNTDFKFVDGFADSVMEKLGNDKDKQISTLYSLFKKVALSGVAAIIIFLITIYFVDGSVNLETIQGIAEYTPGDDELSLINIEDFE